MNDIDVESKFIAELNTLLKKYKVTMSIEYANDEWSQDYINFWAVEKYDKNGNIITGLINYNTRYMDGE